MLEAAMPVLAVTETTSGLRACFFLRAMIMALRSKDFPVPTRTAASPSIQTLIVMKKITKNKDAPRDGTEKARENVPAEPVKNTFLPSSTTSFITLTCSSLSTTLRTSSFASPVTPSRPHPTRTETLGEKNVSIVDLGCFALREPGGVPCDLRLVPCFVIDLLMGE